MVSVILLSMGLFVNGQDSCNFTLNKNTTKKYNEAIGQYKRGNYTQASILLKEVLREEPHCVDAHYVLGLISFKRTNSNFADAETHFQKVLEWCPAYDVYTYYYLGEICYGQERFADAIRYLEKFLEDVDKIKSDDDYNRAAEVLRYSKFYTDITGNPVPFEPTVVAGISTMDNEYLPIFSPDNRLALFTREIRLPADKNSLVQTYRMKERFMVSLCDSLNHFSRGEEMPDPFNIQDNEGGATLTADNSTLYYTVCKYDRMKRYLNCDIYFSEFINDEWTPIKSVSNKINLPMSWESQPSVSSDGKVLYFVSDRNGGFGGYDIYRVFKGDNGDWGTPINLGPVINSPGNEKAPFLHPDGKSLYFSSNGWMGLGGYDIFYSQMNDNGTWSKPKNIGYPINSQDDEVGFFVSTEGSKGYFTSNKYDGIGGWDLYSFDLYQAVRPGKVLFIKGKVRSEKEMEPVKARIELKNVDTKKIEEIPLDSTTGNYLAVTPFNNDFVMTVKKEGYVFESKYLSRYDSVLAAPSEVDVEIKPIELHKSYRINDIYFAFNSFELTAESKAVLDQLIEFLNENPVIEIEIQGHTDNIGNDADNLKLSDYRSRSVYVYLIESGIRKERLTYKGFGESMPVATNETAEGRAKNRRTVFVIMKR